jgi:hypothetical protein
MSSLDDLPPIDIYKTKQELSAQIPAVLDTMVTHWPPAVGNLSALSVCKTLGSWPSTDVRRTQLAQRQVEKRRSNEGEYESPEDASSASVQKSEPKVGQRILPGDNDCATEPNHGDEFEAPPKGWRQTKRIHVMDVVRGCTLFRWTVEPQLARLAINLL